MTLLTDLLSEDPGSPEGEEWGRWFQQVADQMRKPSAALVQCDDADPMWQALAWAEVAVSLAVQERDESLLRLAAAALALVDSTEVLDPRDVRVVGGLLRRAFDILSLDVDEEIQRSRRLPVLAGRGSDFFDWLYAAKSDQNALHEEVGEGASFSFRRKPSSIDIERLQEQFGKRMDGRPQE